MVTAEQRASLTATLVNAVTSGDTALAATLAFNSIGFESQNVLFNAIDTLLGDSVLGTELGGGAIASIEDVSSSPFLIFERSDFIFGGKAYSPARFDFLDWFFARSHARMAAKPSKEKVRTTKPTETFFDRITTSLLAQQ